jgi:hypothetical protein
MLNMGLSSLVFRMTSNNGDWSKYFKVQIITQPITKNRRIPFIQSQTKFA